MRVVIVGNSIVSNLAALYFKKHLPESVEVILIGPDKRDGLPLVGESIIEITAQFLENQLGLGQYLRKNHYPKYALTYYFKLDPDNPSDRTYSVHCSEREPRDLNPLDGWEGPMARPPSWLLNRTTFDCDLKDMVDKYGSIERINGMVTDIEINGKSGHKLRIKEINGNTRNLKANWIIDATGRRRLLARKFGLVVMSEGQRDCFWFRLGDFDRSLLSELHALGPKPPALGESYHYDRYYSTHHFMGRGNWIWLIPLRTNDNSELISIGLSSRTDVYEHDVRTVDSFIEHVSKVHPVVTDFVKSGNVIDTNLLRNYLYTIKRVYSPDRWGIVGDAAFAPDPLFSNGLAFSTIQLEQLGEMIKQDCEGKHSAEFVNLLSETFMGPVLSSQIAITNWYETMDDAYLCSLRLNWIEISYFYMLLPLFVNRCHYQPDRVRLWKILQLRKSNNAFEIPEKLLKGRALFDKPTPNHFIYKGKDKVNLRALERVKNIRDLQDQMAEGGRLRAKYIDEVLEKLRGK